MAVSGRHPKGQAALGHDVKFRAHRNRNVHGSARSRPIGLELGRQPRNPTPNKPMPEDHEDDAGPGQHANRS